MTGRLELGVVLGSLWGWAWITGWITGCGGATDAASGGAASAGGAPAAGGTATSGGTGVGSPGGTGAPLTGGSPASGGSASGGSQGGGSGGAPGSGGQVDAGATCPGVTPPSGYPTCRTSADCAFGGSVCSLDPLPGCGICRQPQPNECETDADCAGTSYCETYTSADPCLCSPPEGPLKRCTPRCPAAPCPAGTTCGAGGRCELVRCDTAGCPPDRRCGMDGVCAPIPCTEGGVCPANHRCAPGSGDPSGCERRSCSADGDCDCGACISGVCQDRLFVCSLPVP